MEKNEVLNMLLTAIEKGLPRSMKSFVDNYDDLYMGWDICPKPGTLIRFMAGMSDASLINIISVTAMPYQDTVTKHIFSGRIPQTQEGEPDYTFIANLLGNYQKIG